MFGINLGDATKAKIKSGAKKSGGVLTVLAILVYLVGNMFTAFPGWKLQALRGVDAEVAEAGMVPATSEETPEVNELDNTKAKLVAAEGNLATAKAEAEKLAAAVKKAEAANGTSAEQLEAARRSMAAAGLGLVRLENERDSAREQLEEAEAAVKEVEAERDEALKARAETLRELDSRPTKDEVDRQVEARVRAAMGGQAATSNTTASSCSLEMRGGKAHRGNCSAKISAVKVEGRQHVVYFADGKKANCGRLPSAGTATCTFQ